MGKDSDRGARRQNFHSKPIGRRHRRRGFETLEVRNLLAAIDEMGLVADTGVDANDNLTSNPALTGSVSWQTSESVNSVDIEFDHHGDGSIDGSVELTSSGQSFTFDPLAVDQALQSYDDTFEIDYRLVTHTSSGTTVGSWATYTMDLDRVAPTVVTTPSSGQAVNAPDTADLTFSEAVDAASVTATNVFVQDSNQNVIGQTLSVTGGGTAEIAFSVLPGDYTTHVANVRDRAGNTMDAGDFTWRANAAPVGLASIPLQVLNVADNDSTIGLGTYIDDPDDVNTNITYEITDNTHPNNVAASVANGSMTLTYTNAMYGTAGITLRATDADGGQLTLQALVRINEPPSLVQDSIVSATPGWEALISLTDEAPEQVQLFVDDVSASASLESNDTIRVAIPSPTTGVTYKLTVTDEHGASSSIDITPT